MGHHITTNNDRRMFINFIKSLCRLYQGVSSLHSLLWHRQIFTHNGIDIRMVLVILIHFILHFLICGRWGAGKIRILHRAGNGGALPALAGANYFESSNTARSINPGCKIEGSQADNKRPFS